MSSAYGYNDANERTRNTQPDGSFWVYQYDSLGQVISGKKYWSDWTPVAGQQFEYSFDDIGNRTATKVGGDSAGANLRSATYGANSLNQYTNRTVPNAADVIGVANALATVNVNGSSTYRRGEYYQNALTIDNSATNVWQVISNYATLSGTNQTNVGYLFSPKTPETFGLDADGNQTSDGRWFFTWDGENRLISMVSSNVADGGKRKLNIVYDSGGRRVQKTTFSWVSGAWQTNTDVEYVYDGWNLIAEVNATNSASVRSFIWGLDLSGSMQGAGGVGGLVAINSAGNGVHFAAYDGNGNVADLINATNGATSAQYEYGPFGEVIRSTGPMAKLNPFRFSTKYQDDESDLLYYGYRYCTASSGRWLNRDPLGDAAFFSQYIRDNSLEDWGELTTKAIRAGYDFVANNPIIRTDLLGLESVGISVTTVIRPPDAQSGVKTIHALSVDEYGAIGNVSTFTGTTIVLGLPVTGVSTFRQWASGSHPKITVTMTVTSHSAALPSGYDIDYNLDFTLDFCSRRGKLSGVHDQYPSYSARVKGGTIYDWQQKGLWVNLWGPGNINPSVSFTF